MGRPKLTPDKRQGLAGLDPDDSLNMLLELVSDQPRLEIAERFFGERAKFFVLHRWLETSLFEENLNSSGEPALLQTLRAELSASMLELANNRTSEFLKIDKRTGRRGTTHNERLATISVCACLHAARTETEKRRVASEWASLTRRSCLDYQDLKRLMDNILQTRGDTADKRLLFGIYASLMDLSDTELKQQISAILSSAKQLVS
jgi:hypothetical protein